MVREMRVVSLIRYPIKSAKAVLVSEAEMTWTGLEHDRAFMIVDEEGAFLSQREYPALARLKVSTEGGLSLTADDGVSVLVTADGARGRARVWDDEIEVVDCGARAAGAITAHLGRPARLVKMAPEARRIVDQRYGQPDDIVSFADGFPVLVATTASLAHWEAGTVRDWALEALRFRVNLIVEHDVAFAEDAWRSIAIGDVKLALVKRCSRCTMVDVDPLTGTRTGSPILAELAKTRREGSRVLFGQNGIPRSVGTIRVGDPVSVGSE